MEIEELWELVLEVSREQRVIFVGEESTERVQDRVRASMVLSRATLRIQTV